VTGRPSKIHSQVTIRDADRKESKVSITDAFVALLEKGCYIGHAAQACGISERTLANWRARGAEYFDAERAELVVEESKIPEDELPYVHFLQRTLEAEGVGITWHELNVAKGAETDPRLSLYFLERRRPKQYGRRIKVDTEKERVPDPVDPRSSKEIEESFDAAHLPEGIEPESILPEPE
jgi:hypothetical protein